VTRDASPAGGEYAKPLPPIDPLTAPFWDSVKAHAMRLQRCGACGTFVFFPRPLCPVCFSDALEWTPVSGRGVVHAFTIPHRHPSAAFQPDLPYVVAIVELEEGPRLMTNLVQVAPDASQIAVGMPVEVVYDDVTPEVTLPKFRPTARRRAPDATVPGDPVPPRAWPTRGRAGQ
jgi:uncharacterized OB-fold protein